MKRRSPIFLSMTALLFCAVLISSCSDDDGSGGGSKVKVSLIKTLGVDYGDGVEGYTFNYDANDRLTSIVNTWEGEEVDVIEFDYSVNGELTITKEDWPTTYEIDEDGRITKEFWDEEQTEWAEYQYNSDGFMTKIIEHWGGVDHDKYLIETVNGNVIRHTRFNDEGEVNRIKEFTFHTAGSDNVNQLQQTNAVDSNWKVIGGLFGKPSKKLVDFLEYWDGPGDEGNKRTTEISYTFDDQDRVATMIRSGDGWQETYTFEYYEDEE